MDLTVNQRQSAFREEKMCHTISVLVENKPGVLARISGLFSGRGFNIDSLAVGETEDPSTSRMTIVVRGDERILEQVTKQLNKLIDVIKVTDLTGSNPIERELFLIRVGATKTTKPQVVQIVNNFQAKVVDVDQKSLTIEMTGDEEQNKALLELLRSFGIKELARTGRIALARSK